MDIKKTQEYFRTDSWEIKNIIFPFSIFILALIFRIGISGWNVDYIEFQLDELSLSIALLCNSLRECISRKELPIPNDEWIENKEKWEMIFLLITFIFFGIYIAFVVSTSIYECHMIKVIRGFINLLAIISILGLFFILPLAREVKSSFHLGRD